MASGQKPADGVARAQLSKLIFARLAEPDRLAGSGVRSVEPDRRRPRSRAASATAARLPSPRTPRAASTLRGVTCTREMSATSPSRSRRTEGDPFAQPLRVSDDRWVLDGCPENGPAMSVDTDKRIHIVWPTLVPGATAAKRAHAGALLRDVHRRPAVHDAAASTHAGRSAASSNRRGTRWSRSSSHGTNKPEARGGLRWRVERPRPRVPCDSCGSRSMTAARARSTRRSHPSTTAPSSSGLVDRPDRRCCVHSGCRLVRLLRSPYPSP